MYFGTKETVFVITKRKEKEKVFSPTKHCLTFYFCFYFYHLSSIIIFLFLRRKKVRGNCNVILREREPLFSSTVPYSPNQKKSRFQLLKLWTPTAPLFLFSFYYILLGKSIYALFLFRSLVLFSLLMAEFPPNLEDGELWLPSDIFLNEVPSKYNPYRISCMEDFAGHFAALSLLQNHSSPTPSRPHPKSPLNSQVLWALLYFSLALFIFLYEFFFF